MTQQDHDEMPREQVPDGGIALPSDGPVDDAPSEQPDPATMIGEGIPLPVGAHAEPEPEPDGEPIPGLPKPADALDREVVRYFNDHRLYERDRPPMVVRPDQATVPQAVRGEMHPIAPRTTREALLSLIASAAADQRMAAREYGEAVREREEQAVMFENARTRREQAEDALWALGLDTERDHETVEPSNPPTIPDAAIV